MSSLTVFYIGLFYFATFVLVAGLTYRIYEYWKTPAPLSIPTTPAPTTRTGAVFRVAREVALFESLFKSNKWIWVFGYLFHIGLALVLLRHVRYFSEPLYSFLVFIQPFGEYASFVMVAGLAGLWARRFLVDRVRYISTPSDHLILALLIAIGISGMSMTFVAHTDIVNLKGFVRGMMTLDFQPLPTDANLLVHLFLVALLMIIFPVSKLLHAPGVFFSPTRNQVDNPREKRHIAPWAAALERDNS
ncbi:MAG: nitrate reductase [Hydrogenophilales bacterium CG03_land_8_20_14_0_80_62_28]|nr:nitrate reductase [Betaproteobacteria bacterium]OIO76937.1 MAG: nitrate reductase [Hydrogenophilaceae bacterium CG1_02_62_390]PIV21576.1 MAG: nitrate reductase [Hydrogenophilales bacterium CG03_land_8_20_14_0_80_62_28]PIW39683.1 MAG: nitrate reductase [Hydrogenophilales bacterium CG15_BIG_FIL_POST_REV_8_21_14_020_62_31]PIW72014.1 MAG: nitrate reductase [Hydrogenophilales bacterium CG12_big_fil_rev_8_21_14_0_65_61_21]PIX01956.1 MAG: nitrate reductase [Hydrogenophilales bacterium CG_4_8_14_3_